jgi:hypothetical protein
VSPLIGNTIGFFASVLHLRIESREGDSFVDLLNRMTQRYCEAYERMDFCYIDSLTPQPPFTRNGRFNWVSHVPGSDRVGLASLPEPLTCSAISFEHPIYRALEMDREPGVLLFDSGDEVSGGVSFPLSRFSMRAMERFSRNFLMLMWAFLRQPDARLRDIRLL